ncbi:dimethylarginine dimethylaminohydrolase family protein [Celerinatantimonas diazotrophica]|uniref:Dimethylargininase n=1 Tax=Celerinatantimonas diazotrophica TaxID=412034 RepID=A0A4R1KAJ4_9GAMM|nr:arginine deiminase family protein [Celerinatantimonas diazotrophica]TCK61476.1 dimethylargininase [Celerinatantimonas diazotrophica]CAG9296939.1 N(G),N(G)-dimethylarginine dimethylaminohydrolase [Celerinatantimonas diazotrophica]
MLQVLTHRPSMNIQQCELTYIESEPIDFDKALLQHRHYCQMLTRCGAQVKVLKDNPELADNVFVEDPIIVFDEVAVVASMGVESRRAETSALKSYFMPLRPIRTIELPAKIEGGDVLVCGRKVYVGQSSRTNQQGYEQLRDILTPFNYEVLAVPVTGCLHLKSGCCALDETTLLVNSSWLDTTIFQEFQKIEVPKSEPFGANIIAIGQTICMNAQHVKTVQLVKNAGFHVETVDISEFAKAEAGLTCMSIRYQ